MNAYSSSALIIELLSRSVRDNTTDPITDFTRWRAHCTHLFQRWSAPVERAIAGGFDSADSGIAFSFGYQAALQQIAPGHIDDRPASFCVTEQGGNGPGAIQSRLTATTPGHFLLQGEKSFVSNADRAELLLVAASTGAAKLGPDGKPRNPLALVLVRTASPGVRIEPLPPLPFAPSIHHGKALFDQVAVAADQWLPGDGYTTYVKPFRTVEDIHVCAALLGFLLRIARTCRWPADDIESLLALMGLHLWLAAQPADDPGVHLVLAGARHQLDHWLQATQPHWDLCPTDLAQAWQRDRALFRVAAKARSQRTQSAWQRLTST